MPRQTGHSSGSEAGPGAKASFSSISSGSLSLPSSPSSASSVTTASALNSASSRVSYLLPSSSSELPSSSEEYQNAEHYRSLVMDYMVSDLTYEQWESVGIPPEHAERIFERFHRVEPSRSAESGGAGLGLAIARRIARLHGGDVVYSPALPRGSVFTLTLPVRALPR